MSSILEDLVKVEGVNVAVCVGRDGFVIESAAVGNADTDAIGAMVSTGLGAVENVGRELGVGRLNQTMSEYDNGIVVMTQIGKDAMLAVVAARDANLGNIRLQVRKRVPDLEKLA
jgi:predicted regulator of Ras-like GTPase activity (Roadblock/LC7/MglB family)